MTRRIHFSAILTCAAVLSAGAPAVVSAQDVQLRSAELTPVGGIVRNQPYSAEVVSSTTQVLGDGTRIERSVTGKVYRDSAGRTRREQVIQGLATLTPSSDAMRLITITDPT